MPQDAFTLRFLCEEISALFSGGKINKIVQPSNDKIIFTIYNGKGTKKLLLDVNPACPKMEVYSGEAESPLTAPNFCMLLRKHLLSATIENIELVGFDRIVKITLLSSAEFHDAVEKVLFVELMGRYSNIILTEKGKILGGNRGINMFDNGVRPLIVGTPYVFPPVGDKKLPTDESLIEYFNAFDGEDLANYICKGVQGLATSTANEIVDEFNKTGVEFSGKEFGKTLFEKLNSFIYQTEKNPCVFVDDGKVIDVCIYPYNRLQFDKIFFPSLSDAENYYFTNRDADKKFKGKIDTLRKIIQAAIKKAKKRLTAIIAKELDASSAEENRVKGELILANIYQIKNGASSCELFNYYDNSTVNISLNPDLSVAKNADAYYKKYNKQKRALEHILPQKKSAQDELDYLLSVLDEIELCETLEDAKMISIELQESGHIQKQNAKKKKAVESFCHEYLIEGFRVYAGRNNQENDKLTFGAKPFDVWLHAKDYHSSHVIISTEGKTVPETVIVKSAEICAYYSKGRHGGKTEIVYTEKKNVKKPPKSKLGFCTYDNFKSMTVKPEKHVDFLKSNKEE